MFFIWHAHLRKDDTHHAPRSVTELHRLSLKISFFVWLFLTLSKRLQREGGWVPLLLVVSFSFEPPTHPTCPYGEGTFLSFFRNTRGTPPTFKRVLPFYPPKAGGLTSPSVSVKKC